MSVFLRKYATDTGTHIRLPMVKAGSDDFAVSADWTPATGDVKVSVDGGAEANIATLPAYSNGWWTFQLSAGETTGKSVGVKVVDAATKAVKDNAFVVETFGNAAAKYPDDLSGSGAQDVNVTGMADGVVSAATFSAGAIDSNALNSSAVTEIQTGLATATALAAVSSYVDTEVAAILAAVDTEVAAIKAKTDNLPGTPAAVGSAMTLQDGSITSAKFTVASYTGLASGFVEKLDQVWRRLFRRAAISPTQLLTYRDDGSTVQTTQAISDDGAGNEVQGAAT